MMLNISDIIKNSWNFYIKNFKKLFIYMVLIFLPSFILTLTGVISYYINYYLPTSTIISNLVIVTLSIASILFNFWVFIALVRYIKQTLLKETAEDWKININNSAKFIGPMIFVGILNAILVFAGTLLLIIPGIIFGVWFTFAYYTILFENKKGVEALKTSKAMVVGRWWAIFWRLLIPNLFFGIIIVFASDILTAPIKISLPENMWQLVILSLISTIINSISTPLVTTANTIVYLTAKQNPLSKIPASVEPPVNTESK